MSSPPTAVAADRTTYPPPLLHLMGYFSCHCQTSTLTSDHSQPNTTTTTTKKKNKKNQAIRHFRYDEVQAATSNFHPSAFLGRGSHGSVFRAELEGGRLLAAAKIISPDDYTDGSSGHHLSPSNEIEILSTLRSPRLVNLLGYTPDHHHHNHTALIAVVELMPNGSLDDHLHSLTGDPLPWPRRVRLALQTAEAVHALHSLNPPVIHRDIKPANVLIDAKGKARLGDFGLAVRGGFSSTATPPPAGTIGYIDPGYVATDGLSTKRDVFSFGILLLEILSGRKAIDVDYSPPSVLDWAAPLIGNGAFDDIWDPRIGWPEEKWYGVMRDVAVLARRCVGTAAESRPEMAEVVEWLRVADRRISSPPPLWRGLLKRVRRRTTFRKGRCLTWQTKVAPRLSGMQV